MPTCLWEATDASIGQTKRTEPRHLLAGNRYKLACSSSYRGRRFGRGSVLYKLVIGCCCCGVCGRLQSVYVRSIAPTGETNPIRQESNDVLSENLMAYPANGAHFPFAFIPSSRLMTSASNRRSRSA
jgi:hypothetical protein